MPFDLPMFFAFIIAFAILAYVVMDGFDLGVGILFPFLPVGRERDSAIVSDERFGRLTSRIWTLLRAESLRALGHDKAGRRR